MMPGDMSHVSPPPSQKFSILGLGSLGKRLLGGGGLAGSWGASGGLALCGFVVVMSLLVGAVALRGRRLALPRRPNDAPRAQPEFTRRILEDVVDAEAVE
mmetsp:Transcript_42148/g.95130  ORF Transcript_42148/g.95130 Transcript_42148/m.95130 type:complete len:100 (-) Transcript_42148:36-335(-)